MEKTREHFSPNVVLENWNELIKALPQMNEPELKRALAVEVGNDRRKDFILRLHRRYTKLRQSRELKEYLA